MMRTSKLYSQSNLQVYSTVLLTIVIMLYLRSPELIRTVFLTRRNNSSLKREPEQMKSLRMVTRRRIRVL